MKIPNIIVQALLAITLLLLQPVGSVFAQSSDYVESGFLQDYSILEPDPERPAVRMHVLPGINFGDYDKVLIADIVLFLHPESEYQGISARKISEVTSEFQNYVLDSIKARRELVTEIEPGDKVIVFRAAITNVYAKRPKRGVLGYTPIGLVHTGVKKAAGSDYVLSTAALEVEALDGQTGEILGSLVATKLGETLAKAKTGERKWEDIQAELREYANTWRDRFK
ncbi:MAG: DUF3313 domain-containing protein [Phycisphaerae bacterium]|nr:DUF3313 domain-containing protein [Phycisphaerae bacterium]NIP55611.1 DUF3313 domain-containing protein [Phycisphaerae bacterium]NIW44395.1 DUF3313 family protein [Gammaproteobacteria bacterium]NIX02070.1 DUF3313 family protein [Phycisphaerae bacterium]NIX26531.1 DUF3313 family protein [Phycisphaerae bacterium]